MNLFDLLLGQTFVDCLSKSIVGKAIDSRLLGHFVGKPDRMISSKLSRTSSKSLPTTRCNRFTSNCCPMTTAEAKTTLVVEENALRDPRSLGLQRAAAWPPADHRWRCPNLQAAGQNASVHQGMKNLSQIKWIASGMSHDALGKRFHLWAHR